MSLRTALGIPIIDHVPGEAVVGLVRTAVDISRLGSICVISALNRLPVDFARQQMLEEALSQKDIDLMMWVDSDSVIRKGTFEKLLFTIRETKAVLVSGHYYQRGYPFASTWTKLFPNGVVGRVPFQPDSGLMDIDGCGLGCALLDLNWIRENLKSPYFEVRSARDGSEGVTWEDTHFCLLIREKGGKIIGDTSVSCGHLFTRREINETNHEVFKDFVDNLGEAKCPL